MDPPHGVTEAVNKSAATVTMSHTRTKRLRGSIVRRAMVFSRLRTTTTSSLNCSRSCSVIFAPKPLVARRLLTVFCDVTERALLKSAATPKADAQAPDLLGDGVLLDPLDSFETCEQLEPVACIRGSKLAFGVLAFPEILVVFWGASLFTKKLNEVAPWLFGAGVEGAPGALSLSAKKLIELPPSGATHSTASSGSDEEGPWATVDAGAPLIIPN